MGTLEGKVALVTGAASGIGRAIAIAYARQGARVAVSDLAAAEAGARDTLAQLQAAGGTGAVIVADVSRAADCAALVAGTVARFGRLDVACNNAGISGGLAPTADYPEEAWDRVIAVNLSGVFHCMRHEIRAMLAGGGGAIVNVASILGAVGFAGASGYVAAKHGVVGLTRTAAIEYGAQGIRVTAVGPAFIHTPMIAELEADAATAAQLVALHPAGRFGTPEEVAAMVTWLSSPQASFVNGSYHPVDGGYLAR